MDLGKHVIDKGLIDCRGLRAGKVDNLLLEVPELGGGAAPEVIAIISGPMALSRYLPRPVCWLAYRVYRLLGLTEPRPMEIPWSDVSSIDVVVHLKIDRDATRYDDLADAVDRRFISRLPGA